MKITYLIDSLTAGGKERQLFYLVNSLATRHKIQLVIFNTNIFYTEINNLPIELIIVPKKNRYKLSTQIKLNKKLKKFSPQIIHAWDKISQLMIIPYQLTHNVKIINGSIRHGGTIKYSLKTNFIRKLTYYFADAIIANSNQGLAAEGVINKEKSGVVYNGISTQVNSNYTKNNEIFNTTNNFVINVVMVGRFFPLKDYVSFIDVAKEIIPNNKDIAFHCIGEGPLRSKVEKEAGLLLNKNIFFWGKRTDIRNILAHFDIGVLLNNTNGHAEGLSNAIMEYMTAKLPVIATNAGGTKELVLHNENGFLVNAFDTDNIFEKLQTLIDNKTLRETFGQKGYEIISKNFSLEAMINNYEKLYKTLIN